jgi:GT2 family glycosyltransferase
VAADVSVIVVAWRSRELVARCLAALDAAGGTASREVIVVDQASDDGTAAWLAAERPDVRLVALERNVGFGAGNNRGAEAASGRWLLLLNPDCFVDEGCIDELVRFAEATSGSAAVGPRLRWEDGRLQRSCRGFPSVWRIATEYLFLRKLAPSSRALNALYCGGFAHDEARQVDWVTGACVLVDAERFRAVGGFDESFFLYSEETDLLRRLRDAGGTCWFDPAAGAVHLWGGTTRRDPGPAYREQLRSHVRYLDKHHGRTAARRGRLVLLWGCRLRAARGRGYASAARWLAARDVDALLAGA